MPACSVPCGNEACHVYGCQEAKADQVEAEYRRLARTEKWDRDCARKERTMTERPDS